MKEVVWNELEKPGQEPEIYSVKEMHASDPDSLPGHTNLYGVDMKSNPIQQASLKSLVRGAYDIQKMRIQTGNRLVANFKTKIGQEPSSSEDSLDATGKMLLVQLRQDFLKITDGVVKLPKLHKFKALGVISDYTELCLVAQYLDYERVEYDHFKRLESVLNFHRIYVHWLKNVKGCGPAMSAVIISEINIEKARHPSSIWKYAGLDVAEDGKGRSRLAYHLVSKTYSKADGTTVDTKGITFNPFLKTKLFVLAGSFLKSQSPYKQIYDDYKHRLEHRPDWSERTKLHRHNAAQRYMIKMFLIDLYREWRTLEGLPVSVPYHEAKLGLNHAA
jgi:hypothetical protein